jgi:hypothetical protein
MTASQISRMLRGKRVGHGKYQAKCPVHSEKTPSLSIKDAKDRVLLHCFGCGATIQELASAMGMKVGDFFYTSRKVGHVDGRWKDEMALADLDFKIECSILANALGFGWDEDSLWNKRKELIFKLYPERKKAYDLQIRIKQVGWEKLWEEFWQENPRLDRANPIIQPLQTSMF